MFILQFESIIIRSEIHSLLQSSCVRLRALENDKPCVVGVGSMGHSF